jgi:orotate phosphoribosyltransferase
MIAGVATGAIAHAALVAEKMDLPFIYVRSSLKSHGTGNLIEGDPSMGKSLVIIEDLVSTGGSSLKAVEVLRQAGLKVMGMLAVFTYGFSVANENFKNADVSLTTLCDYNTLIEEAIQTGFISSESLDILSEWRKDPGNWKPAS